MLTLLLVLIALVAGGQPSATHRDLVDDCRYPFLPPVACDFQGPVVGGVRYRQLGDGALVVQVRVAAGRPDTTYAVLLGCGARADTTCGAILIGAVTTDATGAGDSGPLHIAVTDLQAEPFGPGAREDHVVVADPELGSPRGRPNVFVAAGIIYHVPPP